MVSRRPYPGQRYRHGWIPMAPALRELLSAPDVEAGARGAFEGRFAGLHVDLTSVTAGPDRLQVTASVRDRSGRRFASLRRTIGPDGTGRLVAEHELRVDPGHPASKAASVALSGAIAALTGAPGPRSMRARDPFDLDAFLDAYDAHTDDWYRRSGVSEVKVHADGPGSYFWALRGGLDWDGGVVPPQVMARLESLAASARPVRRGRAQRILARIRAGESVSPRQVAESLGPDVFNGLSWVGVRPVSSLRQADIARRARVALILSGQR